nr:LTA synthase family protein [uncultured Anaerobutyricum sp.]
MNKHTKIFSENKKAIFYFFTAFLIACIGVTLAFYLKGNLGDAEKNIGRTVFIITEVTVLFLISVAIKHILTGKVSKSVGILFVVVLAMVFAWNSSGIQKEIALKPQKLRTTESEFKRYNIKDGHFVVTEMNPYIIKMMEIGYLDNVVIHFSKPTSQKVPARVCYITKKGQEFVPARRVQRKSEKGDTQIYIPLNIKNVKGIKVGVGRKINTQFDLDYIEINGNYQNRIYQRKILMAKYFLMYIALPVCYFVLIAGKKLQEKTDKNLIVRILSFPFGLVSVLSIFVLCLVVNLVEWVKVTCGNVSFSTILLQMTSPIKGTDSGIINSIIKSAVVPPLLITVTIVACYLLIIRGIYYLNDISVKKIPGWSKIGFQIVIILFLLHTIQVQGENIGMWKYMASAKETSAFYKENYVSPDKTKLTFPKKKQNLIYIFMESMESSYADKNDGGIMDTNYIPNLTRLAKENVSFSDKKQSNLGGPVCLEGTAYTAGGLVAQTSAINLKVKNAGTISDVFLPNLTTIGDLLNKEGYEQVFLCGSDGDFAGRDAYFKTHKKTRIEDYKAAIKEGDIPKDYKVFWGHEDKILYERAKKQLNKLSSQNKPFNLTMLTVDTHFPNGYRCSLCKKQYDTDYADAVACADRQVYNFIKWIKQQDFYKDTTIVIAGDHTSMVDTGSKFWKNLSKGNGYRRTVFNTIINPQCSYKKAVEENRKFTTMDMFPTTLAALGVKINGERLGLGTNMFSGKETLREELGANYINSELKKMDKEYNSFY